MWQFTGDGQRIVNDPSPRHGLNHAPVGDMMIAVRSSSPARYGTVAPALGTQLRDRAVQNVDVLAAVERLGQLSENGLPADQELARKRTELLNRLRADVRSPRFRRARNPTKKLKIAIKPTPWT